MEPMFFYWANVAGKVITFCGVTGALLSSIGVTLFIVQITEVFNSEKISRWPIAFMGCAAILFCVVVVVPSEETIYKMVAAKMVTSESIEKVLKGGKLMKDELKRDLIDVIMSVKGEGDKK